MLATLDPSTRRFLAHRHVVDLVGRVLPPQILNQYDDRLREADRSFLLGRVPTPYSSTHGHELHSEVAIDVVTDLTIPYEEAGVRVQPIPGHEFATGYHADPKLRQEYADHVGVELDEDGHMMTDGETHGRTSYGSIYDDPDLGPIAAAARHRSLPTDQELIKILTAQVS
jgi:hypothetical protein